MRVNGQHLSRLKSLQSIVGQPSTILQSIQSARVDRGRGTRSTANDPTKEEQPHNLRELKSIKSQKGIKSLRVLADRQPEELGVKNPPSKNQLCLSSRQTKTTTLKLGLLKGPNLQSGRNQRYTSQEAGPVAGGGIDRDCSSSTSRFKHQNDIDVLKWKHKRQNEPVALPEDGGLVLLPVQSLPWNNQIRFRNNEIANGLSAQDKNLIGLQQNKGQESGMGVIYSNEFIPPVQNQQKFGEGLDSAPHENDFASSRAPATPTMNLQEEAKRQHPLRKQNSHIILSPIMNLKDQQALESKDANPDGRKLTRNQIKNIQLRSARNLPELKSLQVKPTGVTNIVKIHKISKIESNYLAKNWADQANPQATGVQAQISEQSAGSATGLRCDDTVNLCKNAALKGPHREKERRNYRTSQLSLDKKIRKSETAGELNLETGQGRRNAGGDGSSSTERRRATQEFERPNAYANDFGKAKKKTRKRSNASSKSALSVLSSRSLTAQGLLGATTQRQFQNTISSKDQAEQTNSSKQMKETGEDLQPKSKPQRRPDIEIHQVDERVQSKLSNQLLKSDESVKFLRHQDLPNMGDLPKQHPGPENHGVHQIHIGDKPHHSPDFDLLSSIKKSSSQKKASQNLEISKSSPSAHAAGSSRRQEDRKPSIREFDLNLANEEPATTKISEHAHDLDLKIKQISDIPMRPSDLQQNGFRSIIEKLDDNFQLFSDRSDKGSNQQSPRKLDIFDHYQRSEDRFQNQQAKYDDENAEKSIDGLKMTLNPNIQNQNDDGQPAHVALNEERNAGYGNNPQQCAAVDHNCLCDGLERLIEVSRDEETESCPSNRNSIRFIEQQYSLSRSQQQAMKQQERNQILNQSNSSMQILLKLQKQSSKQVKQQNPVYSACTQKTNAGEQDIAPMASQAPITNFEKILEEQRADEANKVSTWQFYYQEDQQTPAKNTQEYEDEMRFNEQIDAIEIIQLNQGNLEKYRKGQLGGQVPQEGRRKAIASLSILPPHTILPPTADLLSPPGRHFELSLSDSNYRSQLPQGVLSPSIQRSQTSQKSNFMQEMENLLPPADLVIAETRDSRLNNMKNYGEQADLIRLFEPCNDAAKHALGDHIHQLNSGMPNRIHNEESQQQPHSQPSSGSKIWRPPSRLLLSNNYVSATNASAADSHDTHIETIIEEDLSRILKQQR